jgi:polysaccharide biosynthesis transport protein
VVQVQNPSYSSSHILRPNAEANTILGIAMRRWRLLAVAFGLGLVGAQVFLWLATPIYSASVQLLIDPRKQAIERDAVISGLPLDSASIESEVTRIRSFVIAKRVVHSLHLDKDPEFVGEPGESLWSVLLSKIWPIQPDVQSSTTESMEADLLRSRGSTPIPSADPLTLLAIETVRDSTQVRRLGLTYAIEITFSSPNAIKAAKIADALAQAYLDEQLEVQLRAARRAADWLNERLVGLRQNMEMSARAVTQYKREHQILETNTGGVEKQQLSELSTQLVQARRNTLERKARYDQSRILSDNNGGFNLKTQYEVALKQEEELEKSFHHAAGEQARLDEESARLKDLEREAESNTLLYENYLQRFRETLGNKSLEHRESSVITPAETPESPSYPRRGVFFFAAASLSLVLGAVTAKFLEMIKNGFSTTEEVENHVRCPVIATIQTLTDKDRTHNGQVLSLPQYVAVKPTSRTGEAIRAIRFGIQLSDGEDPPRVVLFTSSVAGEGKSTLAHSFARSAAGAGQRVAFIDADLRHHSISETCGVASARGLSDYLLGSVPIDIVAKSLLDGRLLLIPAGTSNSNSPDMLGSAKMRDLVARLKESYDLVVVDAPPVVPVIDANVLAKLVDKIIYVIEWEKVPREVVARAIDTIGVHRDKVAGVILNKANFRKMSYHSSYYSYYNSRKFKSYYDGSA